MLSNTIISKQWLDYTPRWARITFRQMMFYGIHLGHSVFNSNPFCGWLIAGFRQGIFLIDLFKFTYQMRSGLFALESAVRRRAPVWFIHPQMAAPVALSDSATRCGEYFFQYPWIGGLLTNHRVIRRNITRLSHRTDAGRKASQRRLWASNLRLARWRFSRSTWPRVIFVSSARLGLRPCHEAQCLGLPALTITDTNSSASLASIAIPANDESSTALWFYCNLFSLFILQRKFGLLNLFLWKGKKRRFSRRQLRLVTAASLFSSQDLWRRMSLARLARTKNYSSSLDSTSSSLSPHPWSRTLAALFPWEKPWHFCHKRTSKWFYKAQVSRLPKYHRNSILRPRVQRAFTETLGNDRIFRYMLTLRGAHRSRPLWVFYQTFTAFVFAFASRWLSFFRAPFRRPWRRPFVRHWQVRQRNRLTKSYFKGFKDHYSNSFFKNSRNAKKIRRPWGKGRRLRLQRIRHPWTDLAHWHRNIESRSYPEPKKPHRRWQLSGSRLRHPRASLQLSRYTAQQLFISWFIHQR